MTPQLTGAFPTLIVIFVSTFFGVRRLDAALFRGGLAPLSIARDHASDSTGSLRCQAHIGRASIGVEPPHSKFGFTF
jgi:hypothetical protein